MAVVRANDISIRYIVGDLKSIGLKDYVIRVLSGKYKVTEFWADRHVTFSLDKGDMLGIIGTNGAGKSTLLKAVSGIMTPTEGTMKVSGKIAALLELSSGFDAELTVRENTYLRGAMMGYTRKFMDEKYDEIIRFAELTEFQNHSFRQLSSGMKSRLGFSIACLVKPDVIILDEVLSVGDGAFRRKSSERLREILRSGVTGILVSHSVDQIRELCNKILWLDHGKQLIFSDEVEFCCDAYEEFLYTKKLPETREDMERLAADFQVRAAKKREEAEKKQEKQIRRALANEDSEKYVEDALSILRRYRPELLAAEIAEQPAQPEKTEGKE